MAEIPCALEPQPPDLASFFLAFSRQETGCGSRDVGRAVARHRLLKRWPRAPGEATGSHPQANYKPATWEDRATPMRPPCDPQATFMRPSSQGKAKAKGRGGESSVRGSVPPPSP